MVPRTSSSFNIRTSPPSIGNLAQAYLANITQSSAKDESRQLELFDRFNEPEEEEDQEDGVDLSPFFDAAHSRLLKAAGGGSSDGTSTTSTSGVSRGSSSIESEQATCLQAALKTNFGKQVIAMKARRDINRKTSRQDIEVAVLNNEYHRYSVLRLEFHFKKSGIVETKYQVGSSHASNKFTAHTSQWNSKLK